MLRILIVEDEEIIRRGLLSTIDWAGMDCCVVGDAPDGRAGLELLRRERPDVVLTDIRMPCMDGIEMAERAWTEGILPQLVFLTSYAEFDYAQKALRLHAADYLLKPVDEAELAALMRRLAKESASPGAEPVVEGVDWRRYFADDGLNPYVLHAMKRIQQDYREKLSIEVLAEEAGVSASYLSRKFKEATGQTFLELLTRTRLQNAILQLSSGKYRVYEVAEENGFGDYKNFCTVFKKYMKCSPRIFLQQEKGAALRREDE
ncbi:two component system response regulator [Centipeda periodontii DSM 2778]|uniref:Two component system response regulator n=1 Tax=Centipeda periodontii DSM 2778 TaxID=888060 RepID=F5RLX8_9FIRM|nr:response regulator [Centipeda periodontii]EGK59669.1 two component system response regulator [Centipeda periodontii DSM 2778]